VVKKGALSGPIRKKSSQVGSGIVGKGGPYQRSNDFLRRKMEL
jgi:hypothetical protein